MQRVPKSVICMLLALVLSGCYISVREDGAGWGDEGNDWRQRQERNQEALAHLQLGRTIQSVTAEMGAPDMTESFVRDGRDFRVLRYRTHRRHDDGITTRDETTPLVFVEGELVGWGESAIDHATP